MYEIGAVVLSSIPPAVAGGQLLQLPRIMASCDAVIRDGNTGSAVRIVEAKHRCPFAPPSNRRLGFTFLGRRKGTQLQTTCEQFAQCQFQMLVLDVAECDLVSYSLGGSRIFRLRQDNRWLLLALQLLQHMQSVYISQGKPPPEDALMHDLPSVYDSFLAATQAGMDKIGRQHHADVPSAVQRSAMYPYFLDDISNDDTRKVAVGM